MKELKTVIDGIGEVRGFVFHQIEKTNYGYIYKAIHQESQASHYEVFKRRENKRFNTISYPSSNSFGSWAWTYKDEKMAYKKLQDISTEKTP
jgi:hypothetical protein